MRIVITGGAGSIGSMVADRLRDKHDVTIFDNSEHGIHVVKGEFKDTVRYEYGSVRDESRMEDVFKGHDAVFHAAAMKHVPICEEYPNEATKTNYDGTCKALYAAMSTGIEKFLFMSTDKTVNPSSHMGKTKQAAERHVLSCNGKMLCGAVRSGNVLGSRGCFFDAAEKLIADGQSVPITDEGMKRYLITKEDLSKLIENALLTMTGGEVFVPQMVEYNILKYLRMKGMVKHHVIGLRDGEKLQEDLFHDEEKSRMSKIEGGFVIPKCHS